MFMINYRFWNNDSFFYLKMDVPVIWDFLEWDIGIYETFISLDDGKYGNCQSKVTMQKIITNTKMFSMFFGTMNM
jgi:hypothetical protein